MSQNKTVKIHLNRANLPGVCQATKKACPLGADDHVEIKSNSTPQEMWQAAQVLIERKTKRDELDREKQVQALIAKRQSTPEQEEKSQQALTQLLENYGRHLSGNQKEDFVKTAEDVAKRLSKYSTSSTVFAFIKEQYDAEWDVEGRWYKHSPFTLPVVMKMFEFYGDRRTDYSNDYLDITNEWESWEGRYHAKVASLFPTKGHLVSVPASTYGWKDYTQEALSHHKQIAQVLAIKEDSWSEFEDTEAGNSYRTGYLAEVVLYDGTQRYARMEATSEEILKDN